MLYFKANSKIELLDEFEGQSGKFVKTFLLNDKRNKNGWRADWQGIKRHVSDFVKMPGIEFVKCEESGCDLDHTDASTYERSREVQEDFRVTNIRDYTLDESTHTAFVIHEVLDDEFYEKLQNLEIKYVSPSIWPETGGYEILGQTENGMPMIDVYDWKALHVAFVNKPAFGDAAKVTAMCEGENCPVKLLSAKELKAEDELGPLKQVSLMVRHKDKIHFFSVDESVERDVQKLLEEKKQVDEKVVFDLVRKNSDQNNSFKTCSCSSNHNMDEKEHKQAMDEKQKEIDDLQSKLKAAEDDKEKQHDARKARHAATFKAMEDDEEKVAKYKASIKAMEDEDELKAMDEAEKEHKATKATHDDKDDEMKASMKAMEQRIAEPLVAKMVKARELKGASEDDIKNFKTSLEEKSLKAIEEKFADEKIFIEQTLSASDTDDEKTHFDFSASESNAITSLSAKSLEEIAQEVTA